MAFTGLSLPFLAQEKAEALWGSLVDKQTTLRFVKVVLNRQPILGGQ